MNVGTLFDTFQKSARHGYISREVFIQCCNKLKPLEAQRDVKRSADYESATTALFSLFDTDHNGVVDFSELASGLSVLCGGTRDDKVYAAFNLFDSKGDGFISKEEMVTYLTSVFTVLHKFSSETRQSSQLDAEVLAKATTEECFKNADLNRDGKLSFDEFKLWYSASDQGNEVDAEGTMEVAEEKAFDRVEEVCRLTNLCSFDVQGIANTLSEIAESDAMDRRTFCYAFRNLREDADLDMEEEKMAEEYVNMLFDAFDTDDNGVVDYKELTSGLSVLCRGSRKDRVEAAFALHDMNGDGFISLDEMTRYLRSVYRVLYIMKPDIKGQMEVGPDELAERTSQQAFRDADRDQDGLLSFDEFQAWYLAGDDANAEEVTGATNNEIDMIRELTNLQAYDIRMLLEFFLSRASNSGHLNKEAFTNCFRLLVERNLEGRQASTIDEDQLDSLLNFLFRMFDTDGNRVVDVSELSAGISVLSGGSRDDKVRAAFTLFDENGDGFISRSEMTRYLYSVFKMLYESSPDARASMQVSPMELATITAKQCFDDADHDNDGQISFEEFKLWYSKPTSDAVMANVESATVTLTEMRRLTNLERYNVDTIFQTFAHCTDENGELSRAAFNGCFTAFIGDPGSTVKRNRVSVILDRLFDLFDGDGNGTVSFDELASGLSILCGGTRDEKVRAAFDLYDIDNNGFIERAEMVCYLSAVFKILFEASPETPQRLNVTPQELAEITTDEAFGIGSAEERDRMTFEEFKEWYTENDHQGSGNDQANLNVTMEKIQAATLFSEYHVEDAVNIISTAANTRRMLNEEAFCKCVSECFMQPHIDDVEKNALSSWLFQCFDADHNGYVDSAELVSGLSILCGGSRHDKVRVAFSAFDQNGDGFISFKEMATYLRSVFSLMFAVKPGKLSSMVEVYC